MGLGSRYRKGSRILLERMRDKGLRVFAVAFRRLGVRVGVSGFGLEVCRI